MPSLIGALEALIEKGTELSRYDRERVFKEGQESVLSQPTKVTVYEDPLAEQQLSNLVSRHLYDAVRVMRQGIRGPRWLRIYDDTTEMMAIAVSGVDKDLLRRFEALMDEAHRRSQR